MKKIKDFFKGVKSETKTIRWPKGKTMIKYSCIVIVMMLFFGLYFYGLDVIFTFLKGLVS